jgi:hypothetical protein
MHLIPKSGEDDIVTSPQRRKGRREFFSYFFSLRGRKEIKPSPPGKKQREQTMDINHWKKNKENARRAGYF